MAEHKHSVLQLLTMIGRRDYIKSIGVETDN